jgi:hypothetical protein
MEIVLHAENSAAKVIPLSDIVKVLSQFLGMVLDIRLDLSVCCSVTPAREKKPLC